MVTPLKNILVPKILGSRGVWIPPSLKRVEAGFAAMSSLHMVEVWCFPAGGGLVIFVPNWFLSPTRFWVAKQLRSKKFVRQLLSLTYIKCKKMVSSKFQQLLLSRYYPKVVNDFRPISNWVLGRLCNENLNPLLVWFLQLLPKNQFHHDTDEDDVSAWLVAAELQRLSGFNHELRLN